MRVTLPPPGPSPSTRPGNDTGTAASSSSGDGDGDHHPHPHHGRRSGRGRGSEETQIRLDGRRSDDPTQQLFHLCQQQGPAPDPHLRRPRPRLRFLRLRLRLPSESLPRWAPIRSPCGGAEAEAEAEAEVELELEVEVELELEVEVEVEVVESVEMTSNDVRRADRAPTTRRQRSTAPWRRITWSRDHVGPGVVHLGVDLDLG